MGARACTRGEGAGGEGREADSSEMPDVVKHGYSKWAGTPASAQPTTVASTQLKSESNYPLRLFVAQISEVKVYLLLGKEVVAKTQVGGSIDLGGAKWRPEGGNMHISDL